MKSSKGCFYIETIVYLKSLKVIASTTLLSRNCKQNSFKFYQQSNEKVIFILWGCEKAIFRIWSHEIVVGARGVKAIRTWNQEPTQHKTFNLTEESKMMNHR